MSQTQSTKHRPERAVVATLVLPGSEAEASQDPLAEIIGLVEAAGAEVVDSVIQKRATHHPAFAFGKGKIEEIREMAHAAKADVVVLDCDLSPSQGRNIEKVIELRVVDRTELILDIFASRASTRQAKLQVELAQMEYMRTRLVRMWTHLERTEGAIGTRGPGETQLETDRRLVDRKISLLKKRLKEIEKRSHRQAVERDDPHTLSLVGYTNAGKSSLLKKLTGSDVYIADQLFATLDTRVRRWDLADGRRVLLADTVGFVRNLPHHLVASFHATLEETLNADLLLHVCDANDPDFELHFDAVEHVLASLDAADMPRLLVFNKADLLSEERKARLAEQHPDALFLSAHSGEGISAFENHIAEMLSSWSLTLNLTVPASAGRLLSDLRRVCCVEEESWLEDCWRAKIIIEPRHWNALKPKFLAQGGECVVA